MSDLIKVKECLCTNDISGFTKSKIPDIIAGNYYQYIEIKDDLVLLQDETGEYNLYNVDCFEFEKEEVIIEVYRGVADVTKCPEDIKVKIFDHDDIEV